MNTSIGTTMGVELEFSSEHSVGTVLREVRNKLLQKRIPTSVYSYDSDKVAERYWYVKEDISCEEGGEEDEDGNYSGYLYGIEITSPPLINRDFSEFDTVCSHARTLGEVNSKCGTHVHHKIDGLALDNFQGVIASWCGVENFMFRMVGRSRKSNRYCAALSRVFSDRPQDVFGVIRDPQDMENYDRYYTLNATHWWRTGRFEIRLHHGTLNAERIWNWMHMTQHILHAGSRITDTTKLPFIGDSTSHRDGIYKMLDFLAPVSSSEELTHFKSYMKERLTSMQPKAAEELANV